MEPKGAAAGQVSFSYSPLEGGFGAELTGVDVRRLPPETGEALRAAVVEHKLLILPGQQLGATELAGFARGLGEPERFDQGSDAGHPEVRQLTNEPEQRTPPYWHSDGMIQPEPPTLTLFYAQLAPPGSATLFLDAQAAYSTLSEERRAELEELSAELYNGVEQPLVRRHPLTGAKALYVDFGSTVAVRGKSREQAVALLRDLRDHCNAPRRVYRHRTATSDLLI